MKKLICPTAAENRAINAGIAADPDTYALSAAEMRELKPVFPRGRPKSEATKEHVTLRLDAKVLTFFRARGRGWQTRINAALAGYVSRQQRRPSERER